MHICIFSISKPKDQMNKKYCQLLFDKAERKKKKRNKPNNGPVILLLKIYSEKKFTLMRKSFGEYDYFLEIKLKYENI